MSTTNYDRAVKAIEYLRENDCDFLTIENVQAYAGYAPTFRDAARALINVMGEEWARGLFKYPTVAVGERLFAVIPGRRWTKVPEYLSNGQLTARWFVDEAAGEVRRAKSWRAPMDFPMSADHAAFMLAIVASVREGVPA